MTIQNPTLALENYFPLTIKTKAFLKPYLEALYGSPICFSFKHTLGTVIVGLLERPYKTHKRKEIIQFRVFDKFETDLTIYLPKAWLKGRLNKPDYELSDDSIIAFNKFFENLFEEDLYKFCELARIYKVERKKAIEDFCMRHRIGIEDHISYECLQKKEYRFHKEQEKLKNTFPLLSSQKFAFKKII